MTAVLVTGSNRGLGLEWTRHYAEQGWRVYATCRHPSEAVALQALASGNQSLSIHRLDVTEPEDIRAMAWELDGQTIDVLLNNAGIYLEKGGPPLGAIRYEDWLRTLEVNTLGAVRVTEALVDNVARSQRRLVVATSSHMGSIADIESPGSYYYRSSKAALNAAMQGLSEELKTRRIGVLILHPGGVATRMGPRNGISTKESVQGMSAVIENFSLSDSGRFIRYDGVDLPW